MKTILPRFLMAACALAAASAFADTKLITDGAPLRYLVPSNGDLGGTWRGPGFNDSSWPAGQNGIDSDAEGERDARVVAATAHRRDERLLARGELKRVAVLQPAGD